MTKQPPPGIRNNNPGNIVSVPSIKWQGQTGQAGRFCVFDTALNGIRALAKNALAKQDKHALFTVRGIITAWAPSNENDTAAYVTAISKALAVKPDERINLHNHVTLVFLTTAIIRHENGIQPYAAELITEGVNLALGATGVHP